MTKKRTTETNSFGTFYIKSTERWCLEFLSFRKGSFQDDRNKIEQRGTTVTNPPNPFCQGGIPNQRNHQNSPPPLVGTPQERGIRATEIQKESPAPFFVYFLPINFFIMKIELREIPIRNVTTGYINNQEDGVIGYSGELNIRPKYQREFVYRDKQRDAVIETVKKGFPLNVMYWVKNPDGTYEVLDGQQRTISICEYVAGNYSLHYQYFHNLTDEERDEILEYRLMVYVCEGSDREQLDWFRTINIAGEKLTEQELRNAIYTGPWLTDAKRYFSRSGSAASVIGSDYLTGSAIRQDYLETAIRWISWDSIESYMSTNQHKPNAFELWSYFQNVINWAGAVFPKYRKEMR